MLNVNELKIISRECKFSNWLKVDVVKAILPNNKEVSRDIVIKGDAVAIVS